MPPKKRTKAAADDDASGSAPAATGVFAGVVAHIVGDLSKVDPNAYLADV